jgi:TetR/AcrR family transcriptional repressor of nem operon
MKNQPAARRGPKPNTDTRSNLIQVGLKMVHQEGYNATGIQSIVEGAGVPKGSFYNHFTSKEAFGAEVIDAYFDRSEANLRAVLCNPDVAPMVRLEAYFDDRIEAFRTLRFTKGCLLGNFSAEAADHSALLRAHLVTQFGAWSHFFESCIAEAQEQGAISNQFPAALLGRFLLNGWEGALLRMRVEKSEAPLMEFKEVVFGKLLI